MSRLQEYPSDHNVSAPFQKALEERFEKERRMAEELEEERHRLELKRLRQEQLDKEKRKKDIENMKKSRKRLLVLDSGHE
jgi:hypothetical protein